jgi:putative transcriptional regulator
MEDKFFNELKESVREGGAILRGKQPPSRSYELNKPDINRIRSNYQLSQSEFATLLGISIGPLRNWEQGRRAPHGPARVLLQGASKHPDVLWDVVLPRKSRPSTTK